MVTSPRRDRTSSCARWPGNPIQTPNKHIWSWNMWDRYLAWVKNFEGCWWLIMCEWVRVGSKCSLWAGGDTLHFLWSQDKRAEHAQGHLVSTSSADSWWRAVRLVDGTGQASTTWWGVVTSTFVVSCLWSLAIASLEGMCTSCQYHDLDSHPLSSSAQLWSVLSGFAVDFGSLWLKVGHWNCGRWCVDKDDGAMGRCQCVANVGAWGKSVRGLGRRRVQFPRFRLAIVRLQVPLTLCVWAQGLKDSGSLTRPELMNAVIPQDFV